MPVETLVIEGTLEFRHLLPLTPELSIFERPQCWTIFPSPTCECGRYRLQWRGIGMFQGLETETRA